MLLLSVSSARCDIVDELDGVRVSILNRDGHDAERVFREALAKPCEFGTISASG